MARLTFLIAAILGASSAVWADALPPTKSLRYLEDYSTLADKADELVGPARLKFIPLNEHRDVFLSLGGEFRERYEYTDEPLFGVTARRREDAFLHRLLVHGDLHLTDRFRAFVQFGSHFQSGREGGRLPVDENDLDLQQGFAEFKLPQTNGTSFSLRVGRQEITFGSGDLVGAAERRNVRRSFDAARGIAEGDKWRADAFVARVVDIDPGVFDDDADGTSTFWGVYVAIEEALHESVNVDIYYFGLEKELARFDQGTGRELRHSIGARLWGTRGPWDFNTQTLVQFGGFEGGDILAWGVGTDTGYTFANLPAKPRVGLKADIASGDRDPSDGTLNTFNALFPRSSYFTEAALIQPSNVFDVNASLALVPVKGIKVKLAWNAIWRADNDDAIYRSGPRPLIAGAVSDARALGHQVELATRWKPKRWLDFRLHYVHFFAGRAVTAGGGSDVDFFMTSVALKY